MKNDLIQSLLQALYEHSSQIKTTYYSMLLAIFSLSIF